MMHGITLVSLIICCEDFVFSLIDRPSLLPVRDMIFCDKFFTYISICYRHHWNCGLHKLWWHEICCKSIWHCLVNLVIHFILQLFSCSLLFDFCNTWSQTFTICHCYFYPFYLVLELCFWCSWLWQLIADKEAGWYWIQECLWASLYKGRLCCLLLV